MPNELTIIDSLCKVDKTSLSFKKEVTKDEWQSVFNACRHIEGCVQFWIGDLLKYREQSWGMYEDVVEETEYKVKTLQNYKNIASNVESSLRREELQFSHHKEVASLPPQEQEQYLQKAVDEKLTVKELRNTIRQDQYVALEIPGGTYSVIYIDPPWSYNDKCEAGSIQNKGADKHYPTMSIDELCNMTLPEISDNAVLFMWTTSPLLEESFEVLNAWGFKYKASFVWDKIKHNMGHYNSVRHEFLLVCTKGSYTPEVLKLFDSVISEEKTEHSKKPHIFYEIIETLYPSSKKIELFARNKREKWESWGNELL